MHEIKLLDTLLIYFNEQQASNSLLVQNLDVAFRGFGGITPNVNIERLCEQLYEDSFLYKEKINPNTGLQVNRYSISTQGIIFFHELPFDKKNEPYSYYLFQQNEKSKKQEEKERLERESIQANIDVSRSVELTNESSRRVATETGDFYEKQTGFNTWQKGLTIAIALFALAQVLVPFLKEDSKTEIIYSPSLKEVESGLNQLKKEIKAKDSLDVLFYQQVKDSLKMK